MNFTLALVALSSVFGCANAALRNSNALVITSDEGECTHDTPKPAEDPHSFLSENGSSTTACDHNCVGSRWNNACYGVDQSKSKIGCGSCLCKMACYRYTGDSIGDNSCTGDLSCDGTTAIIGNSSCNSNFACYYYTGDGIGDNSCTEENSCSTATAIIGNNSCKNRLSCDMATGYIGDNQCNSRYECLGKHFPALSLYKDVLTGACLSPLGKQFNHVSIATTSLSENSPEACAQFCRQPSLTINGFQVGMQIDDSTCFCLYDGGVPPTSLPSGAVITQKGESYGPVESASGDLNPSIECYPLKDYIY
mmetsp:Transcript_3503/g.6351  ORF Transcript_3503/g.6351 Transcript_3503/m.6351 type:complete len:308 (-) Transcript_3503:42-965(-)